MDIEKTKKYISSIIALLKIPGVGRGRYSKLVRHFKIPMNVINASIDELETVPNISRNIASAIKSKINLDEAENITDKIISMGWTILYPGHPEYPPQLDNIASKPPLLFRIGKPILPDEKVVAIVGTRSCSDKGKNFAFQLAISLAKEDITVVSGLAEGIDTKAHQGALEGNGRTIAVLGNALDILYPPSNRSLTDKIKEHGTLYSEYLPGDGPERAYFPERNRIISGLSCGVVVVEAGEKSGALITASHALDQNRELFAVPGAPNNRTSTGTNRLIKSGARLLTSVEDIFEDLPRLKGGFKPKKYTQKTNITDTERKIIELFKSEPLQIDYISRLVKLPVRDLHEYLLALELKGVIREVSGKRFVLSEEYL